ncbi:GNAT family N-acetyltransferase [Mucilaginibacter psychrotolerans]|uniref:GNAT family N-acetyltransferase n=1 Tax=Mucilaginibacter psychrotolerans TaxID=1524096 RepID=A0A4Y8SMN9_9SPHI|nr:N-acetyltransferase [Mucilaginibacter psychrotolerans]TFF39704.1 GNAT family N-acetyltransferase [Mucilaginibacter psychrotolerans]
MPFIDIQRVQPNDVTRLLELSRRTFFDAFAHLNSPADMDAFAERAFTLPSFETQLSNPDSHFYYAMVAGLPAGYIKLNYKLAQTEIKDADALEVERIYVLTAYQGQQIGKQLIDFAVKTAICVKHSYLWLGVWEHNAGAIRFYESKGFSIFGKHKFMLGSDEQTDLLMKKEL